MEKEPKQEFVQFDEQKITELGERLESARENAKKSGREAYLKFVNAWGDFGKHLRTNYPDYDTYRLFHVLGGSSGIKEGQCDKWDFQGEDSVEKWINEL